MAASTATIQHALLGEITGIKSTLGITQFLGVKYASIKERFADSTVFEGTIGNAIKFGPFCPQVGNSLQIKQEAHIQKSLPVTGENPIPDELECLNLNITVPSNTTNESKLPVVVWIHGGGFLFGANYWPQTDFHDLVTLGTKIGKPFIGVSINYRTNIFGFLTSSELQHLGASGNYGIKDQINAFLWVKKFISGFGGNPDNVTAVGESCGGVSTTLLLQSEQPLFRRVVSMGGHALLMAPVTQQAANDAYTEVIKVLGLANLSVEERIEKIRTMPSQEIVDKVPMSIPNRPVIDGHLFKTAITAALSQDSATTDGVPGKSWCRDLLIGDCQADGYILSSNFVGEQGVASRFISSLERSLSQRPNMVESIVANYKIDKDLEDGEAFHKIVALITDVGFYAPTEIVLRGWPSESGRFLFHFNAANPFPGPLQNKASHILDVAFLFQNYNQLLSSSDQSISRAFGESFIRFASNGEPGWGPWSDKVPESFKVFGSSDDKDTIFGTQGAHQRRPFVHGLLKETSYETLCGAIQTFLKGE